MIRLILWLMLGHLHKFKIVDDTKSQCEQCGEVKLIPHQCHWEEKEKISVFYLGPEQGPGKTIYIYECKICGEFKKESSQ